MGTQMWEFWHKISYDWVYVGVMAKNLASNREVSTSHNLAASINFTKYQAMLLWQRKFGNF